MMARKPIQDRFKGKVAIVTGGTAGIGRAIAEELCKEGASVAVVARDVFEAEQEMRDAGYDVILFRGDLADEAFCEEVVEGTVKKWGAVHYLVNNAFSYIAKGMDSTREDWEVMFNVGPFAYVKLIQLCAPHMRDAGGGAVVNTSSISAHVAQPNRWTYNAAKGAVSQITRCAALDLAKWNIRVNSISPGWIWTREVYKAAGGDRGKWDPVWGEYHILGRCGEPVECAAAALFLLSDDASFITGTDLRVDGGYSAIGSEGLGKTATFAGSR